MTNPVTWADLMQNAKGQLEPIPDGDYDVKVIDAQATQSSTGKPMWKVKFEVTSGPHAPRKVFNQFVLSDDNPMALAIFFRHMEAMGLDAAFFAALSPNFEESKQQICQALMNRTCRLTLGQRQFQGRAMQDVKAVLPPLTGGPVAPGVATGPVVPTPGGMSVPSPMSIPTPGSAPTPTVGPSPQVGPGPQAPSGPPPLPI